MQAEVKGFYTPPAKWKLNSPNTNTLMSEKKQSNRSPSIPTKFDLFHAIHKVPAGDSPYVKAKHVQLIEKDPGRAVSLFWSAINAGDRVDSALKDMAVVMKQLDRSDEAIEAVKSFRHLCSPASQESLDNVLVELYKRSGRLEEQIQILQHKLKLVEEGNAFGGKRVKLARSQGKKVHITVEQEYARLLGNLAWAYLQQNDYKTAEEYYRKALSIEVDRNKQCNLAVCLIYMNRLIEAKFLLQVIRDSAAGGQMDESYAKSFYRASQLLAEMESHSVRSSSQQEEKENHFEHASFLGFTPYRKTYGAQNQVKNQKTTTYTPLVRIHGLPRSPFTQPRSPITQPRRGPMLLNRRLEFEKPKADSEFLPSPWAQIPVGSLNVPIESTPIKEMVTSGAQNEEDIPIYKGKKCWADMVEEEEQELMYDVFGGENVNLNMVNSKFESLGLNENPTVCRSLDFNQDPEKPMSSNNRLKVFQDITPSP